MFARHKAHMQPRLASCAAPSLGRPHSQMGGPFQSPDETPSEGGSLRQTACPDVSVGALGGPEGPPRERWGPPQIIPGPPRGPRIRAYGVLQGPHATRSGPRAEAQRSRLSVPTAHLAYCVAARIERVTR
jgi:hypothetical protein